MRSFWLLPLLALLTGCVMGDNLLEPGTEEEAQEVHISAAEVQGTWLFTRPGAASCLASLSVELQAVAGAQQGVLSVSGQWSRPADQTPRSFSGTVNAGTGSFQIQLNTEAGTRLQGTMKPNGTANGDYSGPGCAQKMNGKRQ